jgi:hypothetical protein
MRYAAEKHLLEQDPREAKERADPWRRYRAEDLRGLVDGRAVPRRRGRSAANRPEGHRPRPRIARITITCNVERRRLDDGDSCRTCSMGGSSSATTLT